MSTTQEPSGQRPVHPAEAFDRLIWHNPETCRNCFRRVRVVHPAPEQWGATDAITDRHERTPDAMLAHDERAHDDYGELTTHPLRTTCRGCGSVGCHGAARTLSIEEALERVDRLADRLEEQGLPAHRELMRAIVERAKRDEDLAGRDYDIFSKAVEGTLRHHR
jgi:hypothetical protein